VSAHKNNSKLVGFKEKESFRLNADQIGLNASTEIDITLDQVWFKFIKVMLK
jgi:hypothetical protein